MKADRILARRREWWLSRPWRLAAVEAVDVPEQVVGALHLVEDPASLLGPHDGRLIVPVQDFGEVGEPLVELSPIPRVQRRSSDVVDRSEDDHGSSPEIDDGRNDLEEARHVDVPALTVPRGCYSVPFV
jgi:hypothetical protein